MRVIAIDPGTTKSAICIIDSETLRPLDSQIIDNAGMQKYIRRIRSRDDLVGAVEMLQSYGNLIGKDVLETAVWIGRFYETLKAVTRREPELVYRMEEKMHICHDSRAKDSNIRRALIDRFADHDFRSGRGTIKKPDWFYGFKKDIWSAYAVGLTLIETRPAVVGKKGDTNDE